MAKGLIHGPFTADALPLPLRDIAALRVAVWSDFGATPRAAVDGLWLDHQDLTALHWIVTVEGVLAGCARLTRDPARVLPALHAAGFSAPVAMIERLVLTAAVRGQGLSRELDSRRIEAARARGVATVAAETHERRIPALERLGFQRVRQLDAAEVPFLPPPAAALLAVHLGLDTAWGLAPRGAR